MGSSQVHSSGTGHGEVLGWHPKPTGCTPTKVAWAQEGGAHPDPRHDGVRRSGLDPDPAASWAPLQPQLAHRPKWGPHPGGWCEASERGTCPTGRVPSGPGGPGLPWQAVGRVALSWDGAVGRSEARGQPALTGRGFAWPWGVALPFSEPPSPPLQSRGPKACSAPHSCLRPREECLGVILLSALPPESGRGACGALSPTDRRVHTGPSAPPRACSALPLPQ